MIYRQWLCGILLLGLPLAGMGTTIQSDSSKTEWIKAYFNMPANHSVSLLGNMSKSNADLIGTLESLINRADHSVDLAIYDLEHQRIAQALSAAQSRGVRVRVVTDNYHRADADDIDSTMWATLRKAGIISIDDDGDVYQPDGGIADNSLTNAGADMHHKFAVIDAKSSSPEDDFIWTGSTNLTYTGAYNTNNTIVIKDSGIANAYVKEFEQMWGDDDGTPNPRRAKYHKDKDKVLDDHEYFVGDTKVELYFAPINRSDTKPSIMDRLVEVIKEQAQYDVVFQAFAITPSIPMSRAIWEMSARGEIALFGAIDPLFYYRYRNNGDIWASPEARQGNRLIVPANEMRKLHHKMLLIDANHPDPSDKGVTIAGSYNFSKNAEVNNDENLLIIYSDAITNQYYQDFRGVFRRAQGDGPIPAPPLDSEQWYPVKEVSDGSEFAVEVLPGFEYDVNLLGVNIPRIYAGNDSSEYYSAEAVEYLRNLISGQQVRLEGPSGDTPDARYGAFQAYVTLKRNGQNVPLNRLLLQQGFGQHEQYYAQHPDSVKAYKQYTQFAKEQERGIWKNANKIGQRFPRATIVGEQSEPSDAFPININTADEALLDLLPGIGPAYATRIIKYRTENGHFTGVDQLQSIKGIGPKTMQKLRPNVVVE